jgi:D-arabinose 5-phosphate isomerase GutQ
MDDQQILEDARALILAESEALLRLLQLLDDTFLRAVYMVAGCRGKIIVTGAGTSGAMAYRLAHLLATCGMTAFYIPPGDALHGESAMISAGDVLIALSKAGMSSDINQFAAIARSRGAQVMAWTANAAGDLAKGSDLVVLFEVLQSAEGEGMLPFGSTLAHGAYGDALTLMAKRLRGFDLATLAQTHPLGGSNALARERTGTG